VSPNAENISRNREKNRCNDRCRIIENLQIGSHFAAPAESFGSSIAWAGLLRRSRDLRCSRVLRWRDFQLIGCTRFIEEPEHICDMAGKAHVHELMFDHFPVAFFGFAS